MKNNIPVIWVIDDDKNIEEMLAVKLPIYRFKKILNRNGLQRVLKQSSPCDIIILDYKLEKDKGTDLIPTIRKKYPNIPILLLTAYGTKQVVIEGLSARIDCYQDKPVNFKILDKNIQTLLEKNYGERYHKATYAQHILCIESLLKKTHIKSLKEIAEINQLSYKYLSRIFKEQTGQHYAQFQKEEIVKQVKQLLTTTNLTIAEIANKLGYKYPTALMRLFKQKTGESLSHYRKENKEQNRKQ